MEFKVVFWVFTLQTQIAFLIFQWGEDWFAGSKTLVTFLSVSRRPLELSLQRKSSRISSLQHWLSSLLSQPSMVRWSSLVFSRAAWRLTRPGVLTVSLKHSHYHLLVYSLAQIQRMNTFTNRFKIYKLHLLRKTSSGPEGIVPWNILDGFQTY